MTVFGPGDYFGTAFRNRLLALMTCSTLLHIFSRAQIHLVSDLKLWYPRISTSPALTLETRL